MDADALIEKFETNGQGQVFQFFSELGTEEKAALLEQAASIDLEEIAGLFAKWKEGAEQDTDYSDLEPAPYIPHKSSTSGDSGLWTDAEDLGNQALRAGRVAAFTVAGGQGTRLGFDGPKGTFPATPVKGKPLFQVFAEKILATSEDCGEAIDWLILTSIQNDAATKEFFEEHQFFGLKPEQVHFFTQGLMPAVDREGKILLAEKGRIAMSPDGHGGSLRALVRSGQVERLRAKGVETISYFQVDNPLVNCLDPAFIGFHLMEQAEVSSKMIPKAYAEEKVGHFCIKDGHQVVIEYSDLPMEMQKLQNPDTGELLFVAGSIAIHMLDLDFIEKIGAGQDEELALPFHFAQKKVPFVDSEGNSISPNENNGLKFEMFIFDSLPLAQKSIILETLREDEFSPIKNAEGKDSPATSKTDQANQHLRWLKAAGEAVDHLDNMEISPLFAYSEEKFLQKWKALASKPTLENNLYIQ